MSQEQLQTIIAQNLGGGGRAKDVYCEIWESRDLVSTFICLFTYRIIKLFNYFWHWQIRVASNYLFHREEVL